MQNTRQSPPLFGCVAFAFAAMIASTSAAEPTNWISPSECPGEDDTARVQHALDHHARVYFDRDYEVTSVAIHRIGQHVEFRGHRLVGIAPDAEACLFIRGRKLTLRDVNVCANYGYAAAIRWHSVQRQKPAQYNRVFGMHVSKAKIGLLYGDFENPVDSPQSENAIFGLTFRSVERCIVVNQPNGFLYIVNSVIDCNANEWKQERSGEFDDEAARALVLDQGHVEISNSELLKTSTQKGHMIEVGNSGTLKLSNCHFESGAAAFLLRGRLWASNLSGRINSDSQPLLDIPADANGRLASFANLELRREIAVSRYSGMPVVKSHAETDYRVIMNTCVFEGWKPGRVVSGGAKVTRRQALFQFLEADNRPDEDFVE